ncbi:hypothetical protein BOQ63_034540 [Streptomyces viridifaciens]|nr:hypothetical protein CP971_27605 [Streptomyces viridifaciens]UKZ09051.1 hypothetical protein BOQ63_034540 [Streptomyces viridifaciens]
MGTKVYDQRVLTLIEVRGGARDWAEAEQVFEGHGWPVIGHHVCGEGPLQGVLDPDPSSRVYEVEVRLPGALHNCERGASRRAQKALRRARLETYVRRAEPLVRDREMLTEWQAYDASSPSITRFPRLRHAVRRFASRLGRHDIRVRVIGTRGEAPGLARMPSTSGGGVASTAVSVRPLDGRWRGTVRYWPEEETERRKDRVIGWSMAVGMAAVFAAGATGGVRGFWVVLAALAGVAAVLSGARLFREGRAAGAGMAAAAAGAMLLLGLGPLQSADQSWSGQPVLVSTGIVAVVAGLWLLMRQWSWAEWAAWVVPLVASLAGATLLASGSVLHSLYADRLSLSPGDLDVPPIWQVVSAVKLLTFLSLALVLPAWWGFARHRHHSYAGTGEGFNVAIYALLLIAILAGVATLALHSAGRAAERTIAAAARGEEAPSYFGVEPKWVCVEPAEPVERLSGEGPRFDPKRPYLSFGVAQGMAVLWDRAAGEPLKLTARQVRLVPAESGAVCGAGG